MSRPDLSRLAELSPGDLARAFSLLTRFPVGAPHDPDAGAMARAAWAWPVAGAALGGLAALVGHLAVTLGAPAGMAAALALAALALMTGALHEDGLADTADGLWGGSDRTRRLEIMRDSRIGTFGVLALGLVLLARWSGVEALFGSGGLFWALVVAGAVSRLPMVAGAHLIPPARDDGLAAGIGPVPRVSLLVAGAITLVLALIGFGPSGLWIVVWAGLAGAGVLAVAWFALDGQTGDVLGASQQLAEATALAAAVALLVAR